MKQKELTLNLFFPLKQKCIYGPDVPSGANPSLPVPISYFLFYPLKKKGNFLVLFKSFGYILYKKTIWKGWK